MTSPQSKILILALMLIVFFALPVSLIAQTQRLNVTQEGMTGQKEVNKITKIAEKEGPGIIKGIWQNEVLPFWGKIWEKFISYWNKDIKWRVNLWIQKLERSFRKEVKTKVKTEVEKEFTKEKEEMKKEAPKETQTLWQRLKKLVK